MEVKLEKQNHGAVCSKISVRTAQQKIVHWKKVAIWDGTWLAIWYSKCFLTISSKKAIFLSIRH